MVWEEFGTNADRDAAWQLHLADVGVRGQRSTLLVEAADGAITQNIVEAALDDVQITPTQPLAVALDSFYAEPAATRSACRGRR